MESNQIPVEEPIIAPSAPNDQQPIAPTNLPIEQKQNNLQIVILTLISILSFSGLVYFYLQTQSLKLELSSQSTPNQATSVEKESSPITTPTTSLDPTISWETFTDDIFHITLKHPSKYNVGVQPADGGSGFSILFAPSYNLQIGVLTKYSTKNRLNSTSVESILIGDRSWKTLYQDQGEEGTVGAENERLLLELEMDKKLITVTILNQSSINDEQKQILSTFNFTN